MYTKLKRIEEGFTIVEVLIVLAIAALILIIILIAVPDLQRSARNTDIYHDAQNVAAAVQSYEGNNSGALPAVPTATTASGPVLTIGVSGTATASAHIQSTDSVFFVLKSASAIVYSSSSTSVSATTITSGQLIIDINALCGTSAHTTTPSAGTGRQVAVFYPIEGASTAASAVGCIQE